MDETNPKVYLTLSANKKIFGKLTFEVIFKIFHYFNFIKRLFSCIRKKRPKRWKIFERFVPAKRASAIRDAYSIASSQHFVRA